MKAFLAAAAVALAAVGSAAAGDLPANAVPLTSDEVTKIYSGNTAVYKKTAIVYFAPDGALKGVSGDPPTHPFKGTWSVEGNEACQIATGGDSKVYKDCNKFWKAGKKIFSLWSVHSNGTAVDEHSYWDQALSQFKPGNQVEKLYLKMGGA